MNEIFGNPELWRYVRILLYDPIFYESGDSVSALRTHYQLHLCTQ